MSEKSPYPNFHQPFDSRPTPEATQRQQASREFNNLFDDLMLTHMADVVRQTPPANPDQGVVYLDLTAKIGDQQFIINLAEEMALDSARWRDSEECSRSIELGDSTGNCWGYYLGRDNVVRRLDTTAADFEREKLLRAVGQTQSTPASQTDIEPLLGGHPEAFDFLLLATQLIKFHEERRNQHLAEDMGINNQPVTPDEIVGLRQFLS